MTFPFKTSYNIPDGSLVIKALLEMLAILSQTIVWTLSSHVCVLGISCNSRHVAVVEVVFTGQSPQPFEEMLYDITEQFGDTLLQLKTSPSEVILVRRTSSGGGSGST